MEKGEAGDKEMNWIAVTVIQQKAHLDLKEGSSNGKGDVQKAQLMRFCECLDMVSKLLDSQKELFSIWGFIQISAISDL